MSKLSELFRKAAGNKTLGKVTGLASTAFAPVLSLADVAGSKLGIKGLNNPFFKGAAQGTRIGLGTGAAVLGGMALPAAGAGAGTTVAGANGITTASSVPAAAGESGIISKLLQGGLTNMMGGESTANTAEGPEDKYKIPEVYRSHYR